MMEQVSVIIPCYNDGKYLRETMKSVLAQTYSNIEVIIVDDGSDDEKTKECLNELRKNGTAKVLSADHGGPAAARNMGIREANGTYILPLDADDLIKPSYIEKAERILNSDENVGIVYCKAEFFGKRHGPWDLGTFSLGRMLVKNQIFVTALFRKADWEAVGGFSTELKNGIEDYDFWLSILELDRQVVCIPETLFAYRIKAKSRNQDFSRDIDAAEKTYEQIYKRHRKLYEQYMDSYLSETRRTMLEQDLENQKLRKSLGPINSLNRIPLFHRMLVAIKKKV